jgi:hypothetical protein
VGEQDAGALVEGGIRDDGAHRQVGARLIALIAGEVQASRFPVDMGDPKAFLVAAALAEAAGEESPRGFMSVELQWEFGTLIPHDVQICSLPCPA